MLNCTFGVRFLELYFSYPITKPKTYLLKRTKQVDWKTIERLEDELNKFSSHDDILSRFPGVCDSHLDGIGLNPAEAVAQREHVQSEQPDVKSRMGIYE